VQRFSGPAVVSEIRDAIDPATDLVVIDEAQRFGDDLIGLADDLATGARIDVVVAGWELDATGTPSGPMPRMLCAADLVLKLDDGVCAQRGCRNPASRTQRFQARGEDRYLPVCRRHHSAAARPLAFQERWFEEPTGTLEVIAGCMFSGKTQELIRRLDQERFAGAAIQAFKPALDDRYALEAVASHRDIRFPALAVPDVGEIRAQLRDDTRVVGMDEVQFFASDIVELAQELANEGRHVILAGLDLDFLARPFGAMPQLMAVADRLTKLQASCQFPGCGSRQATRTQRLVDGQPAAPDDPLIVVAGASAYEARCRHHHEVRQGARAAGSDLEPAEALLSQD